MVTRSAATGVSTVEPTPLHERPTDLLAPTGALAILAALRRDNLLEVVAMAAKALLRSSDLAVSLPKVAAEIGSATGVDRTHIFLIDGADGNGQIVQHHLWTVPGLPTPPEFSNPTASMADAGLRSWMPRLERGETITGHVRDLDPAARGLFEIGGVKSVLCVPIFVDGQWKGLIGFDDCRSEREWMPEEIGTIKILAELVGAATTTRRHEAILKTVATSAKELLHSSDLQRSLPKIMERLGQATGVDRVHVVEFEADDATASSQVARHYVWSAPGISASVDFRTIKSPMSEVGLGSWVPQLMRGETVVGNTADFEPVARAFFEKGGIKSVLAVPIFVDSHWRGIIAFDACRNERHWGAAEIETFKTLAELVGGAVARISHLQNLADANRIIEKSPTILYRLSPQPPFGLTYLSHNIRRYGYEAGELLATPTTWLQHIERESHAAIAADIKAVVEGKRETMQIEFRLIKADGSHAWIEGHGYAVRDEQQRLVAIEGILTDVTDRKFAEQKVATLARTDLLTGLPNRAAFLERLNLEFARARRGISRFAVLYLDLDHFKDVNDTLGHTVGDDLLRAVADRLKTSVRDTDMVARFGGDEFAVLQETSDDIAEAEVLAGKIGNVLSDSYTIDGNLVSATASIGIVPYRVDIADPDGMMMKADLALYRAKNSGRNKFSLHVAELDEQTRERILISDSLRDAIKRHELELFYQPQVEIGTGRIVGLEALLRWNHPQRGLILPSTFIPIAETSGSIVQIGEWVIEQACRQIKAWSDLGIAPPIVAVNLSAAQFKLSPDFDRVVARNLDRFGVAAKQLELELTEPVLMETTQKHSSTFDRLCRLGVRIAIDDFGRGYSSLDYLRSFRVARLKIDRRFIDDVCSNSDDATIVRVTVNLAHALGIEVVAEGVETPEQRDFLLAAGCHLAQGYYFGEPAPEAHASALLRQDRQRVAG